MQQENKTRISAAGIARRGDTFFTALRKPGTSIGESWEFPGGKNRIGESAEQTLVREFQEEFKADIIVKSKFFQGYFTNKHIDYTLQAWEIEILTADDHLVLTEHQCTAWKTIEELKACKMAESDRQILQALLSFEKTSI